LAAKIDATLKRSVVASVLFALSSAGFYYLVYLPQGDAQLEPQRVLEKFRAAGEKRAEQEQLLFERAVSEQRAAEQKALKERQALEKANRYEACLSRAADAYNASRLAACNRPREKIIKDQDDCVKLGFPRKVCALAHVVPEASPNCKLPRTVTLSLDADVEKARDRCSEEDKDEPATNATLIRSAGLGPVMERAEPAPIVPPPPKAPASSSDTATVPTAGIAPGVALTEPMPMVDGRPKTPESASKPTAMPFIAGTSVLPHASEAAADAKRSPAGARRAPTQAGWIVQIGAFDIEREAQRQLSSAHAKAGPVLDNAHPLTEVVVKGDKTLYRARFAGFQQKEEAEAVCKQLKLQNVDCITIKN
jgi:SPOR domain